MRRSRDVCRDVRGSYSNAPSTLLLAGELKLLFDERILAEYAEVLARPRFALDLADVAEVTRQLGADGERVVASPGAAQLLDEDDPTLFP